MSISNMVDIRLPTHEETMEVIRQGKLAQQRFVCMIAQVLDEVWPENAGNHSEEAGFLVADYLNEKEVIRFS